MLDRWVRQWSIARNRLRSWTCPHTSLSAPEALELLRSRVPMTKQDLAVAVPMTPHKLEMIPKLATANKREGWGEKLKPRTHYPEKDARPSFPQGSTSMTPGHHASKVT